MRTIDLKKFGNADIFFRIVPCVSNYSLICGISDQVVATLNHYESSSITINEHINLSGLNEKCKIGVTENQYNALCFELGTDISFHKKKVHCHKYCTRPKHGSHPSYPFVYLGH